MVDVTGFLQQGLYSMDLRAEGLSPQLYGEIIHRLVPNDVAYEYSLYVGDSGPAGPGVLPENSDIPYTFVTMDDPTNSCRSKPILSCTAE